MKKMSRVKILQALLEQEKAFCQDLTKAVTSHFEQIEKRVTRLEELFDVRDTTGTEFSFCEQGTATLITRLDGVIEVANERVAEQNFQKDAFADVNSFLLNIQKKSSLLIEYDET